MFDDSASNALTDPAYMDACLHEAMRLWPTTPMLSRETTRELDWDGVTVPANTQLVIVNSFNHRDRTRHEFADRFAPEAWINGGAADDWSFNHFSHGPQGCPGVALSLLVGRTMLATVLRERTVSAALTAARPWQADAVLARLFRPPIRPCPQWYAGLVMLSIPPLI